MLNVTVPRRGPVRLDLLLARLLEAGLPTAIEAVDGDPLAPGDPAPPVWYQARLRTMPGLVILAAEDGHVSVLVPKGAAPPLRAAQATIADQLRLLGDAP